MNDSRRYVPSELWNRAVPELKKAETRIFDRERKLLRTEPPFIGLKLASGQIIDGVVVKWTGEIVSRHTNTLPEFTTEGLDFPESEIVAIRFSKPMLGGLFRRATWID